jgi:UDP-N-acetylmuramoyl-L-alanyl-D-glutamate--2,6-diaminopimelate ligase
MGEVAASLADVVVVTTDNPRREDPLRIIDEVVAGTVAGSAEVLVIPDRRAAITRAVELAAAGDVVLLAGKGHEPYQEVDGVKHHLDDREEAAAALAGQGWGP